MRDEIYCQVIKQSTDNPAKLSRAKGVILLSLIVGCFPPAKTLMPVVMNFIGQGPPGFRPYLNMLMNRTTVGSPPPPARPPVRCPRRQ